MKKILLISFILLSQNIYSSDKRINIINEFELKKKFDGSCKLSTELEQFIKQLSEICNKSNELDISELAELITFLESASSKIKELNFDSIAKLANETTNLLIFRFLDRICSRQDSDLVLKEKLEKFCQLNFAKK